MFKKQFTRALTMVLALCFIISTLPALAAGETPNKIEYIYKALPVETEKYIQLGALDSNGGIAAILGKAAADGTIEQATRFVPLLRKLAIDFTINLTQNIRVEVVNDDGAVLGYIAEGECKGQWGDLETGEDYEAPIRVANRVV